MKANVDPKILTIGYWNIRGLAAPLRMMAMYAGEPVHCKCYDLIPQADGTYDSSAWYGEEKKALQERNPLINLPYIVDGDVVVSQTNACFLYLGRKLNMLGSNPQELTECEQLLFELMDVRNQIVPLAYGPSDRAAAHNLVEKTLKGSFAKLEQWLERKVAKGGSAHYLVGESATAPDFHLFEMLVQYARLAEYFEAPPFYLNVPRLQEFYVSFQNDPKNARYLNSALAKIPFNQKMAHFGATPANAGKWDLGFNYDFADITGVY